MTLYHLKNKQTLLFKNKACEFLKGYTTNTLEAPRNAFVDIRGNIIAAFEQKKINENEVLVVIERQYFDRLKAHLNKYLSLGDTTMEETEYLAYFDLEGDAKDFEWEIPQKKGRILLSKKKMSADVSEEVFTLFRVENNISVQGVDYDTEMISNVGDGEFVSYTKGCYLGQEIVARVHYRGKPPKKLIVRSEKECSSEEMARMTSKTRNKSTGDVRGFIFIEN